MLMLPFAFLASLNLLKCYHFKALSYFHYSLRSHRRDQIYILWEGRDATFLFGIDGEVARARVPNHFNCFQVNPIGARIPNFKRQASNWQKRGDWWEYYKHTFFNDPCFLVA